MMKKHLFKLGAAACLLTPAVWAQQQQQQQPGISAGANVGGLQAGAQATVSQSSQPIVLNVQGTTVTDQSGKALGQIQHILLSPSGCADLALLSVDNKLVPLPWQLVSSSSMAGGTVGGPVGAQQSAKLVAKVDQQKLKQGPSFTMNQVSQITQQQTLQQINNYYGVQGRTEGVGGTGSQTEGTTSATSSSTQTRPGAGVTNNTSSQTQIGQTNQFGRTNEFGRPPYGLGLTNREGTQPGRGLGRPENRPPDNRPPENRPPSSTPGNPGQGPE